MAKEPKEGAEKDSKTGAQELGVFINGKLYRSYSVENDGDRMKEYAEEAAKHTGGEVKKIR